mgnify:CR=1 FL=1
MLLKFKTQVIAGFAAFMAFAALLLRARLQGKKDAERKLNENDQKKANSVRDRVDNRERVQPGNIRFRD